MSGDKLDNMHMKSEAPSFTIDQLNEMGLCVYMKGEQTLQDVLNVSNSREFPGVGTVYHVPFVFIKTPGEHDFRIVFIKDLPDELKPDM